MGKRAGWDQRFSLSPAAAALGEKGYWLRNSEGEAGGPLSSGSRRATEEREVRA